MQRCLAKAIALHGLGLYIYAGEDLPEVEEEKPVAITPQQISSINALIEQTGSDESKLLAYFKKPSVTLLDRNQGIQAIAMLEKKLGVENVSQ
jgi:hypothetical protein